MNCIIWLRGCLRKFFIWFFKLFPLKSIIIFESAPDLRDNTKPVFDELIFRGINRKYKFYWLCFDRYKSEYPNIKNVRFVRFYSHRIMSTYLRCVAKVVISCNKIIGVGRKGQFFLYLTHGSPIKDVSTFYTCPDWVDYIISDGEYFESKTSVALHFDSSRCVPLGFPRNDVFFKKDKLDISLICGDFKKYIIWYPTVKQYSDGRTYGIKPISFLDDEENVKRLNDFAKKQNTLIIVKPHFAQIANMKIVELSNIIFIDDKFYKDRDIVPYEFIGACDALLSDYSSVFYDYMLCNKPIGLVWNDVEEFKRNVGFFDFYPEVTAGCCKIYTFEDLCSFIKNVAEDMDELKAKREEVIKMIDAPHDGRSASRVADFIIKRANL